MPVISELRSGVSRHINEGPVCPLCGRSRLEIFFECFHVPVQLNVLWSTPRQAVECARGDIRLGFCAACGCVMNAAFDPQLISYESSYDNSLHFSAAFEQYAHSLAEDLVARYQLYNKSVLEIGCGQGEFLSKLCNLGNSRGLGIDPAYAEQRAGSASGKGIKLIRGNFSDIDNTQTHDFICCRHVLEHISEPKNLVSQVSRMLGKRASAAVYFEVPNTLFTLRDTGVWDIIYPHCWYFSSASLRTLFRSCGFHITILRESFGGQYLCLEARLDQEKCSSELEGSSEHDPELLEISKAVDCFPENYARKMEELAGVLASLETAQKRLVLWGAGAKGVTFLNRFSRVISIGYVVDINPRKWGKFISGTGQEIVAPEFLKTYSPDFVLITNANYRKEIEQQASSLGLQSEFILI